MTVVFFDTDTIDSTNVFVQRILIDWVMVALTHPTKHVAFSIPAVRTQEKQGSAFVLGQSWIVLDTSLSCDIYIGRPKRTSSIFRKDSNQLKAVPCCVHSNRSCPDVVYVQIEAVRYCAYSDWSCPVLCTSNRNCPLLRTFRLKLSYVLYIKTETVRCCVHLSWSVRCCLRLNRICPMSCTFKWKLSDVVYIQTEALRCWVLSNWFKMFW